MNNFKSFVISFLSSYLLIQLLMPFLGKISCNFNSRSSHFKPIPSSGGIVFVLVCSIFHYFLDIGEIYFVFH